MGNSVLIGSVSKLKQGDLLRVCQQKGWSQQDMGEALGLSNGVIGDFINMKRVPKLTKEAQELVVQWTGKLPEELVPEWLVSGLDALDRRTVTRFAEVNSLQLESHRPQLSLASHEQNIIDREALLQFTNILTPRRQRIVRKRFGLSGDGIEWELSDIARTEGCSYERVKQIIEAGVKQMASRFKSQGSLLDSDPKQVELKRLEAERLHKETIRKLTLRVKGWCSGCHLNGEVCRHCRLCYACEDKNCVAQRHRFRNFSLVSPRPVSP